MQKIILISLTIWAINLNAQTIYLIGDAGKLNDQTQSVFSSLNQEIEDNREVSVLVLGDNIYSKGLEKEGDEAILDRQLKGIIQAKGLKLVLPGNHDWDNSGEQGLAAINKQEAYIESFGDRSILFTPIAGEPGPEWFELGDSILIITFDSQWWLHEFDKNESCLTCSDASFLATMDSLITSNKDRQLVIAAHHPMYSLGHHGGHYSFKEHLKPFPIVGSLLITSKWLFPSRQQIANRRFRALKKPLSELFDQHGKVIYASGHDHSLQFLTRGRTHYLISGSSAKSTHVKKARGSDYSYEGFGYMKVSWNDGQRTLFVYSDDGKLLKTIQF